MAKRIPWILLGVVLLAASPALAQEQAEDDGSSDGARFDMKESSPLRREKYRQARRGWAWTAIGTLGGEWDSNAHNGPDADDVFFSNVGIQLGALRYLTEKDRLRVEVDGTYSLPSESRSKLSEHAQGLMAHYRHRFSDDLKLTFYANVEHQNDHATTIDGDDFERDFEYVSYRAVPSLYYDFAGGRSVRLSYRFKRKNYFETTGLPSLDWLRHGPEIRYTLPLPRFSEEVSGEVELEYEFGIQNYDQEPAALTDGTEPAAAPEEEHHFHRVGIATSLSPLPGLVLHAGYGFKRKDDQFEDFESYDAHEVELGFDLHPMPFVDLELVSSYEFRDYDHRAADAGSLEYDRWRSRLFARHRLSPNLSLFGGYRFTLRDTNRSTGTSYLDYEDHRVMSGLTIAY